MSTISYFLQLEHLDCGTVQYRALVPPKFFEGCGPEGKEVLVLMKKHEHKDHLFLLLLFKRQRPHGSLSRDTTQKMLSDNLYLPYIVCMRRTETLINYISFSGRAVFTDIHRMTYMLQYVGFDGSKRLWDCRKDENYLNGMKFNVDIALMDWYRVCLLHRNAV